MQFSGDDRPVVAQSPAPQTRVGKGAVIVLTTSCMYPPPPPDVICID